MAKTEVILIESVSGLGGESDQVKVAAGYARNFLFPEGLAVPLTRANKRRIEALRQRRAEREAHEFNSMNELAKSISKLPVVMKVKTGDDGKIHGSVTSADIAEHLRHHFEITLDKKKIHLEEPIRKLGSHEVELRLHTDVQATLKVTVESLTPLPEKTEEERAPRGKGTGRGPTRGGRPVRPRSETRS